MRRTLAMSFSLSRVVCMVAVTHTPLGYFVNAGRGRLGGGRRRRRSRPWRLPTADARCLGEARMVEARTAPGRAPQGARTGDARTFVVCAHEPDRALGAVRV